MKNLEYITQIKTPKIPKKIIDSQSKYLNQTNLYIKFRYYDICYSNLYVIYYFLSILRNLKSIMNFKI